MADDSPKSDPPTPGRRRRVFWPGGLSARLLLATVLMVAFANLLIVPTLIAIRQQEWLSERVAAGELASLSVEAAPGGKVNQQLAQEMLNTAGVVAVLIRTEGVMRLVLAPTKIPRAPYRIDLRAQDPVSSLSASLETLFSGGDRMIRVIDRPRYRSGEAVEILVPDAPLRQLLLGYMGELLIGAVLTSAMAGGLVYLILNLLFVRPMQRITRSMERFRANPDDPDARLPPSGRRDEIGRAEVELDRMQGDLRTALASRARLAALGEAVAKINHEMRNMLTSAQIASERLAASGDPAVARVLPRLERALDRAVTLATNVLTFGRSEEPKPEPRPIPLKAALEAAAEDARLSPDGVRLETEVAEAVEVTADPDQLHRIFVNLMRNSRESIDGEAARHGVGRVRAGWIPGNGAGVIRLADDGPGLPERAQANLFQPFAGSARRGGTGLGLAIARELAQANGGDLVLVETGPSGTVFDIRLPGAPVPAAQTETVAAPEAGA